MLLCKVPRCSSFGINRVVALFNVAISSESPSIEIDAVGKKELPGWLNVQTLEAIATSAKASEKWS